MICPDSLDIQKYLANRTGGDSGLAMIRPSFLDSKARCDRIELARDVSAAHRLARRANVLVLLDDGMSCAFIAKVLFLDDNTITPDLVPVIPGRRGRGSGWQCQ